MRKTSSPRLDWLAALPALLLVAYTVLTQPVGGNVREHVLSAAAQLQAETAGGRANMVRPEHMQMCAPDAFAPGRESRKSDSAELVLPTVYAPFAAATPVRAAKQAAPAVIRCPTHGARGPPTAA